MTTTELHYVSFSISTIITAFAMKIFLFPIGIFNSDWKSSLMHIIFLLFGTKILGTGIYSLAFLNPRMWKVEKKTLTLRDINLSSSIIVTTLIIDDLFPLTLITLIILIPFVFLFSYFIIKKIPVF